MASAPRKAVEQMWKGRPANWVGSVGRLSRLCLVRCELSVFLAHMVSTCFKDPTGYKQVFHWQIPGRC